MTTSPTDLRALALIADGRSTSQAAIELGVSATTVRRRVRRVRAALGARTTIQAAVLALRAGLIRVSPD